MFLLVDYGMVLTCLKSERLYATRSLCVIRDLDVGPVLVIVNGNAARELVLAITNLLTFERASIRRNE